MVITIIVIIDAIIVITIIDGSGRGELDISK